MTVNPDFQSQQQHILQQQQQQTTNFVETFAKAITSVGEASMLISNKGIIFINDETSLDIALKILESSRNKIKKHFDSVDETQSVRINAGQAKTIQEYVERKMEERKRELMEQQRDLLEQTRDERPQKKIDEWKGNQVKRKYIKRTRI